MLTGKDLLEWLELASARAKASICSSDSGMNHSTVDIQDCICEVLDPIKADAARASQNGAARLPDFLVFKFH